MIVGRIIEGRAVLMCIELNCETILQAHGTETAARATDRCSPIGIVVKHKRNAVGGLPWTEVMSNAMLKSWARSTLSLKPTLPPALARRVEREGVVDHLVANR